MARLTRSEIEQLLLAGAAIPWSDASGKSHVLQLNNAVQRRLFAFLLSSNVREAKGLPAEFITDLAGAFDAADDPASAAGTKMTTGPASGPWRLQAIETESFGGVNTYNGSRFRYNFDGQSLLLEGPNGSGKSSLIGAILWALTGERPRDQTDTRAEERKPVFAASDRYAGDWPPIACYPSTESDLNSQPFVFARLSFQDPSGTIANVDRTLLGGVITPVVDPAFKVPPVLLETGFLMPARLARLRLDDGGGLLTDAVQKLTGLDDLVAIGLLADGLCHGGREYRTFKSKELAASRSDFDRELSIAREALATVEVKVPPFAPVDTDNPEGPLATLGRMSAERAAQLAQVVADDLAPHLDLSIATIQNRVIAAISNAQSDIQSGLEGLGAWKQFRRITEIFDDATRSRVEVATMKAREAGQEAIRLRKKSLEDSRFQLKAVATKWHSEHVTGPIENCPLCQHPLNRTSGSDKRKGLI